jgi:enolase
VTELPIVDVFAWEALDSRGKPTVGCEVTVAGGASGRAIVPSGASTGSHEAVELRDGGTRYGGQGTRDAVRMVNHALRAAVSGMDARDQGRVDATLEGLDVDPALANVGANAVLAVSLATVQAAAAADRFPLWSYLAGGHPLLPMPMVNIISGGAHAGGLLDIQDVLVVPVGATSFAEAIEWASRVRRATAELLDTRGGSAILVADEGGLAGALGNNSAALSLVVDGIARAGLEPGTDVAIAIDFAANQLWTGSAYALRAEQRELTPREWLDTVVQWCREFPIVSVEDALIEDDWSGWAECSAALGATTQVLGDDFFATNYERLTRAIPESIANAVLVKPNQAGSVSRARRVLESAHVAGYATVVSARSGDTEDTWLADLAVGWRAGQIKVGSTMRSERTAKWNRLLEIEARAGDNAEFAGRTALAPMGGTP